MVERGGRLRRSECEVAVQKMGVGEGCSMEGTLVVSGPTSVR